MRYGLLMMRFKPPSLSAFLEKFVRPFSASSSMFAKSTIKRVKYQHRNTPPYPYGISRWYKKSNLGLYGGLKLRTGHNVSKKTESKTKRRWYPNVVRKKLYSEALGRAIQIKVTTRVLRTIDKVGGLDEYLLGDKPARIKELGMFGWLLRWRIMKTPTVRERFKQERERLGLSKLDAALAEQEQALSGMDGNAVSEEELGAQIQHFDAELNEHQVAEAAEAAAEDSVESAVVTEQDAASTADHGGEVGPAGEELKTPSGTLNAAEMDSTQTKETRV